MTKSRRNGALRPKDRHQAVIYARVSSKEQEREGFSIPAQLRLLREYAVANGFSIVEEFVDVETAKQSGRSGFGAMLKFLNRRSCSCRTILVEKTDRLYRNIRDWVTLDELDLDIHFVKEGTVLAPDSRSSDKFLHGIKVLMAKNFIDNLSEEVRKGMAEKAEEGIWPSRAPLGYRNVQDPNGKKAIAVDRDYAPLVGQLFDWYASGRYSLEIVAKMARHAGLRYRRSGAPITKTAVHRILRNPLYQGDIEWDGRLYQGTHEPLVSRELFARVQDVLDGRPGKHRVTRSEFAFAGLVICGHCGCSMTAEMKKGRYVYYHCTSYRGKCGEPYVREEVLEERFTSLLGDLRIDVDVLDWMVAVLNESSRDQRQFHDAAIKRLEEQDVALQRRLEAIYIDKLDGNVDTQTYDRLVGEWRSERSRIAESIHKHREEGTAYFAEGARLLELAGRCQELFAAQPPGKKRQLLDFVVSNCSWSAGQLTATFRQPFDLLVQTRKTVSAGQHGAQEHRAIHAPFDIWYPQGDSNP